MSRARFITLGRPTAVAFARERVLTQMRAWEMHIDASTKDAIRLVTSELVTNAVVHTGSSFITMELSYDNREGRLLLVVHDSSPAPPKREYAKPEEDHGRGLELVAALCCRHGWEPTNRGKRVWAEFDVPTLTFPACTADPLRPRNTATGPCFYPALGSFAVPDSL
ncbi:ATP-binding protein [Streptomyces sp. NPDC050263]|uniref:ATP-binding protein n=1 Tax=Streptomyces sp. NPDC050263 TaxID=3155037 RepID=UPI003443213C